MGLLLNLFRRSNLEPPAAVVQAACNVYGIAPERFPAVRGEKLDALSDNIWLIKLNEQTSAVVAYTPGDTEQIMAAPWFNE